jgi:hypothetical protein
MDTSHVADYGLLSGGFRGQAAIEFHDGGSFFNGFTRDSIRRQRYNDLGKSVQLISQRLNFNVRRVGSNDP